MTRYTLVMRSLIGLSAAILALALPSPAHACSCAEPPPPALALQRAAAVFEGTAIAAIASDDGQTANVGLRVSRQWKGTPGETISVMTAANPATCGFPFESGKTYLVYAETMNGQLAVSLCSRTRPIEAADDDIASLGLQQDTPTGDPVATRPAPPMLETHEPVRPVQDAGCACTGKTRAEFHTAAALPLWILVWRLKRWGHAPRS